MGACQIAWELQADVIHKRKEIKFFARNALTTHSCLNLMNLLVSVDFYFDVIFLKR